MAQLWMGYQKTIAAAAHVLALLRGIRVANAFDYNETCYLVERLQTRNSERLFVQCHISVFDYFSHQ
jgi:hypothetical protein